MQNKNPQPNAEQKNTSQTVEGTVEPKCSALLFCTLR